ncbi:hypothetical protein [Candidatus Poriferisocius sp.]|uniref:hypothetical protein n=1 Tax=Candidatus Poriferisocius sp. TaxID=3101276 RepID=UPI003B01D529
MRRSTLLASALALFAIAVSPEAAVAEHPLDEGAFAEAEGGEVEHGDWIEVLVPGLEPSDAAPGNPTPSCYRRQGSFAELNAWLENDYFVAPDPGGGNILKLCPIGGAIRLAAFWARQPVLPLNPRSPTAVETARLGNEAWGRLAIPEPATQMAPGIVTLVQIPTYVWVPAADRTPVSETATATLNGQELSVIATAYPRRLGFLRVDMGDGSTIWCDADEVAAFDLARDPLDQPSSCFHHYRRSSVSAPDLRYRVVVTAYWDVVVECIFNGAPCTNPPPAVPTQAITAPPHRIAVAEIQAPGRAG